MLSAFPAVYEILADDRRPSTSGSEVEETITSRDAFCVPVSIMVRKCITHTQMYYQGQWPCWENFGSIVGLDGMDRTRHGYYRKTEGSKGCK